MGAGRGCLAHRRIAWAGCPRRRRRLFVFLFFCVRTWISKRLDFPTTTTTTTSIRRTDAPRELAFASRGVRRGHKQDKRHHKEQHQQPSPRQHPAESKGKKIADPQDPPFNTSPKTTSVTSVGTLLHNALELIIRRPLGAVVGVGAVALHRFELDGPAEVLCVDSGGEEPKAGACHRG